MEVKRRRLFRGSMRERTADTSQSAFLFFFLFFFSPTTSRISLTFVKIFAQLPDILDFAVPIFRSTDTTADVCHVHIPKRNQEKCVGSLPIFRFLLLENISRFIMTYLFYNAFIYLLNFSVYMIYNINFKIKLDISKQTLVAFFYND